MKWADSMESSCYLRNVQDLQAQGETPFERRFGEPFKGPVLPFFSMLEYHPIAAKDQTRLYQCGKEVLPRIFLGSALYVGEVGKEMIWSQTLRSWNICTRQKSMLEDSMQRQ